MPEPNRPEPTRTLQLPGNRRLAVDVLGSGQPVLALHGLPGSRLQRHPDAAAIAERVGVSLICYDRPGFGRSDPVPGRSIADSASDIEAVLDALRVDRCRVFAWSGGGAHALAACSRLGPRIERALLVNPMGPLPSLAATLRLTRGMLKRNRLQLALTRLSASAGGVTLRLVANAAARNIPAFVDSMLRVSPPPDVRVLTQPDIRAQVELDFAEAFARSGSAGAEVEARLLALPWDIPLHEIDTSIELWCSTDDVHVAPAITERLAHALPKSTRRVFEGEGHFLFYDRWAEIMANSHANAHPGSRTNSYGPSVAPHT